MEQQGKYYNEKYPDTSNEWTRNWDKSWLLAKDKYLLNFGSEKERKDSYRHRMFRIFVMLFIPQILLLLPYGLNIYTMMISILGYIIGCRLYFLLISVFNILLFIVLPIYVFLHLGEQIHYFLSFFAYFFLVQGSCFVIYTFYKFYLKEFDDRFFSNIYKKLLNSENQGDKFINLNTGVDTKYTRLKKAIIILFSKMYIDIGAGFVFIRLYKIKKNNFLIELFKIEYFRLVFVYGWLYLFRRDIFIESINKNPIKQITYFTLFINVTSFIFIWTMISMMVLGFMFKIFGVK